MQSMGIDGGVLVVGLPRGSSRSAVASSVCA
jgi:hypothetical protein